MINHFDIPSLFFHFSTLVTLANFRFIIDNISTAKLANITQKSKCIYGVMMLLSCWEKTNEHVTVIILC